MGFSWPKEFGGSASGNRTDHPPGGGGFGQSATVRHLDDGAGLGRLGVMEYSTEEQKRKFIRYLGQQSQLHRLF